jgi:hypothetical protein
MAMRRIARIMAGTRKRPAGRLEPETLPARQCDYA